MIRLTLTVLTLTLLASCGGTPSTPLPPSPPTTPSTPTPPTTPSPEPTTTFIPVAGAPVGSGDGTVTGTVRVSPSAEEVELLTLTNELRTNGRVNGQDYTAGSCVAGTFQKGVLKPLTFHGLLSLAARKHSTYLSEESYDGHFELQTSSAYFYGSDGRARVDRAYADAGLPSLGFKPGEIVATGNTRPTPAAALRDWMASPGHCAILMNTSIKYMGAGYHYGPRDTAANRWGQSWTMTFY